MRLKITRNLEIDDVPLEEFVTSLPVAPESPYAVCGIHVTTLIATKRDPAKVKLNQADFIFADGYSIHLLAKLSGAQKSQRIATTDLVHDILAQVRLGHSGEKLRVAFIGGEPGVSQEAAQSPIFQHADLATYCTHGFHDDWNSVIDTLNAFKPHLVLIGFGMPLELDWIIRNKPLLPGAIYVTCGGMLRILAGRESRSPRLFQMLKIEWAYRWACYPRRVGNRYALGFVLMAMDSILIILKRIRRKWK